MKLTTEQILVHPKAFGLETASPLQRAICRMRDGIALGDLADHPDVIEAFGGAAAVAALPVGVPPREVHVLAAIRAAKSMISAAGIIRASQTVDVSGCSRGDIIRHPVVSLRIDNTRAVMGHLVANLQAKPLLRSLVACNPDELTLTYAPLRHPSGRIIEVSPIPLDRAGGAAQSFWFSGIDIDEEPRMLGEDSGVKNWDHLRDSSLGRIRPLGQLFGIGAPHAPFGPIYDLVNEHHGRPTQDMVVVRASGPAMNPVHWTPERCAELQRQNPIAYATDVLGQFADADSAMLAASDYDAATRATPLELPPLPGADDFAAIDPSGKKNAFALVMGRRERRGDKFVVRVIKVRQWLPGGRSLDLDAVFAAIAKEVRPYNIRLLHSDQFSIDSNDALARRYGLRIKQTSVSAANKFEIFSEFVAAIGAGRFEPNSDPTLRADCLSMRRQVTQSGVTVRLASTGDGRHSDYLAAAALLNFVASVGGNRMNAVLRSISPSDMNARMAEIQRMKKFGIW